MLVYRAILIYKILVPTRTFYQTEVYQKLFLLRRSGSKEETSVKMAIT